MFDYQMKMNRQAHLLHFSPAVPYSDKIYSTSKTLYKIDFVLIQNKVQRRMHQNVVGTKMKSFHFIKVLGQGNWGTVYQAFDQKSNSNVAIKAIPKILMNQTPKLDELVRTEIRVLRDCKNDNVIKLVDTFFSDRTQFIAMEYCDGGDLQNYLNKKTRLTQDQATTFLKQILNGFRGLHEVNAMHRDFKAANVLLHQGICKIADLGFAKQMEKKSVTRTILGTSLTMAPELLREKEYGMQADIWSVGVVYYQLLYGKYPYTGLSDFQILKSIEKNRPDFSGVNISAKARDFIERCLTDNPKERISWLQVYKHPLIQSQEKMLYGLSSRININQNIDFYNQDIKINEEYIYAEKKKGMKKKQIKEQVIVATQKVDMNKWIKENEQKKKIGHIIQKYEKIYLNKRNNIMFIFKFVTPYICNLYNLRANHAITLFILTKKAYHDMKCFVHFVSEKRDFLKLREYFKEFTQSAKYQAILDVVNTDLQIIRAQLWSYKEDIEHCSNEIKRQFDIQGIFSQHWGILVQQTIQSYEYQLGQKLDKVNGERKNDLIKVVQALIYYRSRATADVESFDKKIETLNYQIAQANLRARFEALFQ